MSTPRFFIIGASGQPGRVVVAALAVSAPAWLQRWRSCAIPQGPPRLLPEGIIVREGVTAIGRKCLMRTLCGRGAG